MPYIAKGKCVYKKNKDGSAGEKVGCTDGSVDDYLASLYANTDEAKQAPMDRFRSLKERILKRNTSEDIEYNYISDATYDDGSIAENFEFWDDVVVEAEYQGRKVTLNKPMQGDVKKSKVYVKDPTTGNVKKVNFGDPNMRIKKSNPKRRKSFRARHKCKTPGPKTKARYWSCKAW